MSNICFVGCGASNLFSILKLVDSGYSGKITVIDKGMPPGARGGGRDGLLFGFAGAGLKSDGKLVFSLHKDRTVTSLDDRILAQDFIKKMVAKFSEGLEYNISKPVPKNQVDSVIGDIKGVNLLQSEVWHLGTSNNREVADRMYKYLVEAGVNFMWNCSVVDIWLQQKILIVMDSLKNDSQISYDNLQVGMGKTAVEWFRWFAVDYNLAMSRGVVNIGARFETPYNDTIRDIAENIQYDFKFSSDYGNKVSIRTFCTNNASAYVIKEEVKTDLQDVLTFNGHAYGLNHKKHNGLTNFAILARVEGENSIEYHNKILNKFSRKGAFLRGSNFGCCAPDRIDLKPSLDLDKMKQIDWTDMESIYGKLSIYMQNFIYQLKSILKHDNNYILYVPEVKMAAGVLKTNESYQLADGRYPEVTFVGDLCTGAVGIVPSAVTGIMGIKRLTT